MTLKEIWQKNQYSTDKERDHQYLCIYDELFLPFKDREINILEVGVATGGSLKLWEKYFSKAFICGIDIINEITYEYSSRVCFWKGDINKLNFNLSSIDIAIDDGSHLIEDQIAFCKLVWPVLNKGGIMIIEDVMDLENAKNEFSKLDIPYYIVDLRCLNNRWDNVLIIFRKW